MVHYNCKSRIVNNIPKTSIDNNELSISYLGKKFIGNNHELLIEQLEIQGFRIPYSCRVGICGCCKLILVSGKVKNLKKSSLYIDKIILCCSCIPAGDIILI